MARLLGSLSAVLSVALFAGGALAAGCAMSAPADLTPDLDPTLPGIDAAYDPLPAAGGGKDSGAKGSSSESSSGGSSGSSGSTDSGTQPVAPTDSGTGVDSAPPPPPPLAKPSPNEVLITEIMYDTFGTEPDSEWIELHSVASVTRVLTGLTIKDGGGRTHVIAGTLNIAPNAYLVLARSTAGAVTAKVPPAVIVYEYGESLPSNAGVQLANGVSGGVSLLNGPVVISQAPYGGWFSQSGGSSLQLHVLNGSQSAMKASWCLSSTAWTTGSEKGTPGAAEDCP